MTSALDTQLAKVKVEQDRLVEVVLEEMARVALSAGITKMEFYFVTTFYKGRTVVENEELEKLEQVYLDHISDKGFIGFWTPKKGWQ